MNEKIGHYFIRLELLSFEQAEHVVAVQSENSNKKFGEIALELGYITAEDIKDYLELQKICD